MNLDLKIYGARNNDDKWQQMYNIYKMCNEAKIEPPESVYKYFNRQEIWEINPFLNDIEIKLSNEMMDINRVLFREGKTHCHVYKIAVLKLSDVPKNVRSLELVICEKG